MFLRELFQLMEGNDDSDHARALAQTGYWGKQGAGSIPLARATKRFLIAHRSDAAHARKLSKTPGRYFDFPWRSYIPEQPGTWGTWGGAIDSGEDPEQAARRELREEAGRDLPHLEMVPLYVYRDRHFRYSNFLAIVDDEFRPILDWETQGYRWCEFGEWPQPIHFGLKAVLNDPASKATITRVLGSLGGDTAPPSTSPTNLI